MDGMIVMTERFDYNNTREIEEHYALNESELTNVVSGLVDEYLKANNELYFNYEIECYKYCIKIKIGCKDCDPKVTIVSVMIDETFELVKNILA